MTSTSKPSNPNCVASQRLIEKKWNAVEQLATSRVFLDKIEAKKQFLAKGLCSDVNYLCRQFAAVKNALDAKMSEMTKHIRSAYWKESQLLGVCEATAKKAIEKAEVVLKQTDKLLQRPREDKEYVLASQALEESIMEMLVLPCDSLSVDEPNSVQIDVSDLLKCLETLKLIPHHQSHSVTSEENRGVSHQLLTVMAEPALNTSNTVDIELNSSSATIPLQQQQSECHQSSGMESTSRNSICCNIVAKNCAVGEDLSSKESKLEGSDGDLCVKLKYLQLAPGETLQVVVTRFTSPFDFSAQPYGQELVTLMKEIGNFDEDLTTQSQNLWLNSCPRVGDCCCALFTEDDCWYRAKVTAIEQVTTSDSPSPQIWVTVDYVDYGNTEKLPLDRLRPLEIQFSKLPCQALHCCVSGIEPLVVAEGELQNCWSSEVCYWLSRLLLGNSVTIVVNNYTQNNQASVSLYIPADNLLCTESLTCIPIPSCDMSSLSKLRGVHSLLNLTLFMCSMGLAKQPDSDCNLAFPGSVAELDVQNFQPEAVHSDQLATTSCKISENASFSLESSLQPLRVDLGTFSEFSVLISSIISPNRFFVHPIQENIASAMVELSKQLNMYYSNPINSASLPDNCAHSGTHCCAYAECDKQWYRGVIISVRENHESSTGKECLVYALDFGDAKWIPLNSLQIMTKDFYTYPALCVCCTLSGVNVNSGSSTKEWEEDSIHYFFELTESLSLIAVVSAEVSGSSMECTVNTVVPLVLYDTSGDVDTNINLKIKQFLQLNVKEKVTRSGMKESVNKSNSAAQLCLWNPMETDFLSRRNLYSVNDEDTNIVLQGYRSTNNRLCRYFNTPAGCFQGDTCPFLHLNRDTFDKQLEGGYVDGIENPLLPSLGDWILVIVTAVISVTQFYIQMPVGHRSPLLSGANVNDEDEGDFFHLSKEMNLYYHRQVFTERDLIKPCIGEIVAALYSVDNNWYRARVLDIKGDFVQVCYIDYGNVSWISSPELRSIKSEFLVIPFQAVKCYLPDVEFSSQPFTNKDEAKLMLEDLVVGKVLFAQVVTRTVEGTIGLYLYSNQDAEENGFHINKAIMQQGKFKQVSSPGIVSSCLKSDAVNGSRLIPG